jgi:hypothetical protein
MPPANDNFASATALTGAYGSRSGDTNVGATTESGEPAYASSASVWYSWTAPRSGQLTIGLWRSNFDTRLALYTGTVLGSLALVASDDDSGGSDGGGNARTSRVRLAVTSGTTYSIQVGGFSGATGTIDLDWYLNDNFADAEALAGTSGSLTQRALGCTAETSEDAPNPTAGSVWFTFTPASSGASQIDTIGSGFDTLLALYTGSVLGSLTLVASDDDSGGSSTSKMTPTLVAGTVYHVKVTTGSGSPGPGAVVLNWSMPGGATALHAASVAFEQTLAGTLTLSEPLNAASSESEQTLAATLTLTLSSPLNAASAASEQTAAATLTLAAPLHAATAASEQTLAATLTISLPLSSWVGDDDLRLDVGVDLAAWLWLEPAEALPPVGVHISDLDVVSQTLPAPTLADGVPVGWRVTTTRSKWGRLQVIVGGVDVSHWRGKRSRVVSYAFNEPLGDADAALYFPQITEYDDLSTISWWRQGAEVTIRRRHPDGTKSIVWEGLLASEEPERVAHCLGVNYQLDLYLRTHLFLDDPVDIGHRIAGAINERALHHGFKGARCVPVDTGILTREQGAGDPLATSFIQGILATAQTASGEQWTLTLEHPRRPVIRLKDRTTVHWTVDNGAPGVTPQLSEDYTQAPNVEYGQGTDGSCFWENRKFPNLHADTAPLYPLSLGDLFTAGSAFTGFGPFGDELRANGYNLVSDDTYSSADFDDVKRFQGDAGILDDGIVGPQTWAAAFQVGSHQGDLSGAWIAPLAEDKTVEPFLYNAQGAQIGDNPTHDNTKLRVEKMTLFGDRTSKHLGVASAKQMLARDKDAAYVGTMILTTDPAEGSRRDITDGQNIKLRRYRGRDVLLHIARAEWDEDAGSMTMTVDEKARDLMTVAEVHQRNRDVANPVGQPKPGWRSGGQVNDKVVWACDDGAGVVPYHAQFGGLWTVLRIPAGQRGSVAKTILAGGSGLTRAMLNGLLTDPLPSAYHGFTVPGATELAVAVFGREVTSNMLANLLGNPLASLPNGDNPWDVNADQLTEWGCQYAAGGPGQAGGFYPRSDPGDGSGTGLSGRFVDAAGWPFESNRIPWLWVAMYTTATCFVGGRLYPAADA